MKKTVINPSDTTEDARPQAGSADGDSPTQQQQGLPSVDEMQAKWKKHVGSAKVAWGELTEDELLKSEGHAQKLTGLVEERYAINREEAEKQVNKFLDALKR